MATPSERIKLIGWLLLGILTITAIAAGILCFIGWLMEWDGWIFSFWSPLFSVEGVVIVIFLFFNYDLLILLWKERKEAKAAIEEL